MSDYCAEQDERREAARALQIWPILIGKASRHATCIESEIARIIGIPPIDVGECLNRISIFCERNGLPPLPVLVATLGTLETGASGAGEGYSKVPRTVSDELPRVYGYDWSGVSPPTLDQLGA